MGYRKKSARRAQVQTVLLSRDPHHRIAVRADVVAGRGTSPGKRRAACRRRAGGQLLPLFPDPSVTELVSRVVNQLSPGSTARPFDLYLSLPKGVWVADAEAAFDLPLLDAAVAIVLIAAKLNGTIKPNSLILGYIRKGHNGIHVPVRCRGVLERLHADDALPVMPEVSLVSDSATGPSQDSREAGCRSSASMEDVVLDIGQLLRLTIADLPDMVPLPDAQGDDTTPTMKVAQAAECGTCTTAHEVLNGVLASISPRTLARQFAQPVERAQSLHEFSDLTVDSYEVFLAALWPFYVRLLVGTGSSEASPHDAIVQSDCLALLDQAYAEEGGLKAAWAEARDGLHGGFPCVTGKLAQQFIKRQQATHVASVICEALQVLSWNDRIAIMRDLMARLAIHIRDDAELNAPEKYVEHVEGIARTYIHSLDLLRTSFSAL